MDNMGVIRATRPKGASEGKSGSVYIYCRRCLRIRRRFHVLDADFDEENDDSNYHILSMVNNAILMAARERCASGNGRVVVIRGKG